MKKSGLLTFIYALAGVSAMFGILVAVNFIAGRFKMRLDLTADKAYTLSAGTRNIVSKLDTPVQVRFYCSQGDNMPVMLKPYAQRVEDLLGEYRQLSKGKIEIQKLNPAPDSDAEDSAKLDGIEPQPREDGENIYLGLSVTMLDKKEVIPFLSPANERQLEYDISRAISRVTAADKPVVGVMSPLPMAGMSPMMMRGRQPPPPWVFYSELKGTYTLKQVEISADKIPDDVKVLLLVHPKGLSDATQYAIDQFVLRGGKLIAFLDPLAALDPQGGGMMGGGSSSSLDKLLKAWGLTFDSTKVVADMNYVARLQQGRNPAVLALNEKAANKDDVVAASADSLFLIFCGAFTGTPVEGLQQMVLLKSSKESQLVDPMSAQMGGEQLVKEFVPSNIEYPLAVKLTGKFKTAYPDGKPKAAEPAPGEPKPDEKKPPTPNEPGLKESAGAGTVVLVGDSDMLQDQIAVRELQTPFRRVLMPQNSNLAFALGAVDQLSGDENLITIRSRASRERPFTIVNQMQADAEASYRSKIKEIESRVADSQRKLAERLRAKGAEEGQRFILSKEDQQEIANLRKAEADGKKELKEVRKNLRMDIDSLETRHKFYNIAVVPFVVIIVGIVLAIIRHQKRAAT
jgi:ABC-type uncharacterized transport system involved in gliding motility auxiliary subunit